MILAADYSILFQTIILVFSSGLANSLIFGRSTVARIASFAPAIAGSLLLVIFAVLVSISGSKVQISDPFVATIPALAINLYVDGMAAFFMLILGLVTFAVSIYSIGYSQQYSGKNSTRSFGFLFNLFVLSMLLVIASNSIYSFLIFWELMSLASFFLVIYDHQKELNIKSGLTYIVMTHIGTAFILASFLVFYIQTSSFSFDSFREQAPSIPQYVRDISFVLAFIGFGAKSGLVPLHIWLPQAHPSAPSNISSLMSAVMIKVAIYGLVRTTLDFGAPMTPDSAWWGVLLASGGAVSCIIGVLYAAIEKDIKKALAYSSIENAGIILLGLGMSVLFQSYSLLGLAALALLASMFHSLNHALFKSLLFMGAGAVVFRTHTKKMDQLGGLIKYMPWTALLFLIGALSISGLPPFNGFVSEWLVLQTLLSSYQLPNLALQVTISVVSVVFALTMGLALATFIRIFGITFLARPRSEAAHQAKEAPKSMIVGMSITASICVAFGIFPFIATSLVSASFGFDKQQHFLSLQTLSPFAVLGVPTSSGALTSSSMSAGTVALMMGCVGAFCAGLLFVASGRKTARKVYSTWDCGFGQLNERMQYTASSLSQPLRVVFKILYKPHNEAEVSYFTDSNRYLKKSAKVETHTRDVFNEGFYQPVVKATTLVLDTVRKMQTGKINAYLLYIMIALVAMLVLAEVTR